MIARFNVGDDVRVRDVAAAGHVRTPQYVRGKAGSIERICGAFRNPEDLAYGRWDGATVPLYRVRFASGELWAHDATSADCVEVEIYEHWLEPANR